MKSKISANESSTRNSNQRSLKQPSKCVNRGPNAIDCEMPFGNWPLERIFPTTLGNDLVACKRHLMKKRQSLSELKLARRELRARSRALTAPQRNSWAGSQDRSGSRTRALDWGAPKADLAAGNQSSQCDGTASRGRQATRLKRQDQQHLLDEKRLANIPELSGQTITQLAGPAREVRVQSTRLKQAKEHAANDKKEVDRLQSQIEEFLAQRQQTDLHQRSRKQNELITNLRQYEELEERLEKLIKHRKQLDGEAMELARLELCPATSDRAALAVYRWWRRGPVLDCCASWASLFLEHRIRGCSISSAASSPSSSVSSCVKSKSAVSR